MPSSSGNGSAAGVPSGRTKSTSVQLDTANKMNNTAITARKTQRTIAMLTLTALRQPR